jgi:hypothetical protein
MSERHKYPHLGIKLSKLLEQEFCGFLIGRIDCMGLLLDRLPAIFCFFAPHVYHPICARPGLLGAARLVLVGVWGYVLVILE